MLVKDIIIKSCNFICQDELANKLKENQSLSEAEEKMVADLVEKFNLTREEIASEYQPILKSQEFEVKNFKLPLNSFSSSPLQIFSVKDKLGRNVNYKLFDDYIFVCGKNVEVIFSTLALPLGIEDEFSSTLPERVYAYGTAREYYFANSHYEDANMWEGRFKGSLEILLRRQSQVILPKRRWL